MTLNGVLDMRPLFALLITLGLLGTTFAYVRFAERIQPPALIVQEDFITDAEIRVEITSTTGLAADEGFGLPTLVVAFRGREVFSTEDAIAAGQSVVIGPLEEIVDGRNALSISGHLGKTESMAPSTDEWSDEVPTYSEDFDEPASPGSTAFHAVRVRIRQGNLTLADKAIWLTGGQPSFADEVTFNVRGESP